MSAPGARDYEALREAMLDLAAEALPEWTDRSPGDMGVLLVELMAWLGEQVLYHQDRVSEESYLPTATQRQSVVDLLRLVGVELRPPQPARVDLTLTLRGGEGAETIAPGQVFRAGAVEFRYQGDAVRLRGSEPRSLPVTQVDLEVRDRLLGLSDGAPLQQLRLPHAPVILDSLELRVAGARWRRVASLMGSGPADPHYRVEADADGGLRLHFGDGLTGATPPKGAAVTASYLVGGGQRGNLPAGSLWQAPGLPGRVQVENPEAASGGLDLELPGDAARRGPLQFRSRGRAVTEEDYLAHARALGAGQVAARPSTWQSVELVAAPASGGHPSDEWLHRLEQDLQAKAPLPLRVRVRAPRAVALSLSLELERTPGSLRVPVEAAVEAAVRALYAPDAVALGAPLHLSKVYEAIEALPGVDAVYVSRFSAGGDRLPEGGRLALGWDTLPRLGALELRWRGGEGA